MNYRLSYYMVATDLINDKQRLVYSTRTSSKMLIDDTVYQHLKNKEFDKVSFDVLNKLFFYELIVPAEEDEFKLTIERNKKRLSESRVLEATIQPTANCQLGCHYCGQVHNKKTMSKKVGEKVINRIENIVEKDPVDRIMITWYGGEPLLGYSRVKELSERLLKMCSEKQIHYGAVMITNGLSLKKNIFEELVTKCSIHTYQITMDTMPEHHDQRRITKGGEATFDIIFQNILDVVNMPIYDEEGCKIVLRMNIDKTNYESVPAFIEFLASHNLQSKVSLSFAPIVNWGGNGADAYSLDRDQFATQEIDWLLLSVKLGFAISDLIPERTFMPCMVVKDDWEVYDAYGNIYPCYEFSYTPFYETDKYTVGNLALPEETYNMKAEPRTWYDDIQKGVSDCPTCNLFPVCGGGCPKKWYLKEDKGCPSFKFNFKDLLVLDYLNNKASVAELI